MLVFAHTGITLGAAALLAQTLKRSRFSRSSEGEAAAAASSIPEEGQALPKNSGHKVSWWNSLADRIDIRLLLVGSLLPDIVDKPLGQYFFRETFSNGRIFCHTLLFLIVITAVGLYLYKRSRRLWLLTLSFGTFAHLVLDEMWLAPQTLFRPIYGFSFESIEITNWAQNIYYALLANPKVYIPELAGAAVLIWFGWVLLRRRTIGAFIKYGRV